MPFTNPEDLTKIMEMSDARFMSLFEKIDEMAKHVKSPDMPEPPKQKTTPAHAGVLVDKMMQEQTNLANRGAI